jgi:hypothetical protein
VTSYSWRIGTGPLRVGKEVWVNFSRPVGTVSVTLLIEYNKNGNLLTDTFTKQINVGSSSSFGGNYNGVITTEGQADQNAVVQVGVLQSSSGRDFYGVRDVVPGFPVEINITPTSRAFGFDFSFFTTQTQFNVNNVVMSLPQGIGYLKGDSLFINYGYRQFPAMGELQNYQTKKLQYRGKKI